MKRLFRFSAGRQGAARDVADELRFHIDMRAKEFMAQGMTPDAARRAAERAFGDLPAIEDVVRTERVAHVQRSERRDWFGGVRMDVTFAFRALRKNPGFSAAAVATLTLGIGATIAVFTIVNGVLLRPFPYGDPSRLGVLWMGGQSQGLGTELPLTSGYFLDARSQSPSFTDIAAFRAWPYTAQTTGAAEQIAGARVSPGLFDILDVRPYVGHVFADSGDAHLAMLSYAYWQRHFGGDRDIVGKQIALSGETFTITGVMPAGFAFPRGAELLSGLQFRTRTDVWTPLVFSEIDKRNYGTMNLAAIGRFKPGVTHKSAQTELTARVRRFLEQNNAAHLKLEFRVMSLAEQASYRVRRSLLVLMGAVGFVLLIACANVANLLIGRTQARQREFAVRAALGAGRGRIARQLVTENVVLAGAGSVLGLALSIWAVRAMLALMPAALPRADDIRVDATVLALAAFVALAAGTLFGIATAFHLRRTNLATSLQAAAGRLTGGTRRIGRRALVVSEISLSLILLIGAAQLTRSFMNLQRVAPGFDATNTLVAGVLMPLPSGFNPQRDAPAWQQFFSQLTDRMQHAPGVKAVGAISVLPLTGADESGQVAVVGRPAPLPGQGLPSIYSIVAGDYFGAMRIRVLEGRAFDARDVGTSEPVAVVNHAFVQRYFPNESALGKQITTTFEFFGSPRRTIIGIVDDVHQASLSAPAEPQTYLTHTQMSYPAMGVVIRAESGDPRVFAPVLSREVRALSPSASVNEVRTLDDVVAESLARQRFSMTVILIFAAASILLAIVGLYGVIALSVRQRQREIGVRMALGAGRASVVGLVLGEGVWVTAIGVTVGLVGAAALSRVLTTMLYDAQAIDVALFGAAALGVATVSLVATYVPARRAVRVMPTIALRAD